MKASEAKLLTQAQNKKNSHFEFCIEKIKKTIEKGQFSTVINSTVNEEAQKMLTVREDEYNDVYISWKD